MESTDELILERPDLATEKQYPKAASGPYNLSQMNSNDFATMVYWLYRTEIFEGPWKADFDDIAIMKSTQDAGRDCVLYQNGSMQGAIQCKHTVTGKSITELAFLIEYTKFLLYSVVFPDKVNISQDFVYT